jgi:hypothetical protein
MTTGSAPARIAVLVERVEILIRHLEKIQTDLDCTVRAQSEFRTEYERRHAEIRAAVEANRLKSTDHDEVLRILRAEVKTLISVVEGLQHTTRAIVWLGGLVGGAIVLDIVTAILQLI